MKAWHFLHAGNKMRDGQTAPKDGVKLVHTGELGLYSSGLHASLLPHDALTYAPGAILCLVECGGRVIRGDDKLVCTERTILSRFDATEMLGYFARMQALKVTQYWDAPDIVIDWLMTGDNSIESAAYSAARSAAWSAAGSAAGSAAWSAAWSAAGSAAESAARSASYSAARSAAESAARSAAESAARSAAGSASYSAARSAAGSAAYSLARSAAGSEFDNLVYECFEGVIS